MEINKKGVSDVVTTVLMILLVIAAIGILWVVISRFVQQGTSSIPGTADCLTASLSIASATNTSGSLVVKVSRGGTGTGNITALKFFVDGISQNMNGNTPNVGETQTFTNASALATSPGGKTVSVAAVIGTKTCDTADTATVV